MQKLTIAYGGMLEADEEEPFFELLNDCPQIRVETPHQYIKVVMDTVSGEQLVRVERVRKDKLIFLPFYGYFSDDASVIRERLKELTVQAIREHLPDTKILSVA